MRTGAIGSTPARWRMTLDRSWQGITSMPSTKPASPASACGTKIRSYPRLEEVAWVQEEPRNMGAWLFVAPRLRDLLHGDLPLLYVGRTRRASPAEGSSGWHARGQKKLVEDAFRHGAETTRTAEEAQHAG